ncbi:hypothetical protein HBZC1_16800 [Helicobacter bizzozeronii CIII-1]|uniref:Uncharacterized protein n=1 Tax=Helicobacter bizzozeronii (strain CIII-1) TaxID=1002804 RepID=F8KPE2_HELBC|nr:hypothetical protein HBZC1_16800 [Helicobacter bizzozeronii CIII-1]
MGLGRTQAGVHLALTGYKNGENVHWLEKLSDAQYNKALDSIKPAKSAFNPFTNSPLKNDPQMFNTFTHFALQEALQTSGLNPA